MMWRCSFGLLMVCLLSACSLSGPNMAPVADAWQQPQAKEGQGYRVRTGDTLYSIAWSFGLDYRALADANGLTSPYEIHPGQRLRMVTVARGRGGSDVGRRASRSVPVVPRARPGVKRSSTVTSHWINQTVSRWHWPTRGRIVERFSRKAGGNKGFDIAGKLGQAVRATAAGEVVYAGDGVRGYGNLVLIKHNNSYLSAYAYNRTLRVRLGQRVKPGQVIATMGRDNAGHTRLHFEIRRNGQPVNPSRYVR